MPYCFFCFENKSHPYSASYRVEGQYLLNAEAIAASEKLIKHRNDLQPKAVTGKIRIYRGNLENTPRTCLTETKKQIDTA